ncbi:MAG: SPOR domain-containing protein [Psychrobacter sp.]|nr:SPOR domain-containing protein [Psychrobacter sp.]
MNFSRQTLLGIAMMIGGSVVLYAMVQQIGTEDNKVASDPVIAIKSSATGQGSANEPLTTDIETEQRILAQKQKEREARVAEQERRTKAFLAEQEQAEAKALAKARAENQQYVSNAAEPVSGENSPEAAIATPKVVPRTDSAAVVTNTATPQVQARPTSQPSNTAAAAEAKQKQAEREKLAAQKREAEQKAAAKNAEDDKQLKARLAAQQQAEQKKREQQRAEQLKAEQQAAQQKAEEAKRKSAPTRPTNYVVQRGDGLIRLARQYNVPVEVLAQANNMKSAQDLRVGQEITIPSQRQISRLQREAQEARQRQEAAKTAQQRLAAARQEAARGEAKGTFGVQVALADNQEKADEVAKKLRAAGYRVSTSQTSRGVRVIVGPETGKPAALALKDKINADPKAGVNSAWVLYWR